MMLFSSAEFIFIFLPLVLLAFRATRAAGNSVIPRMLLLVASLVFYGVFEYRYVLLLLFFVGFNYYVPVFSSRLPSPRGRRMAVGAAVAVDLGILAFFKYSGFIVQNVGAVSGIEFAIRQFILPIGISFFTFQCIMFVVDHRDVRPTASLLDFALYITFFPQLIAGPIIHHRVLIPQIQTLGTRRVGGPEYAAAILLFGMGLFKKTLLADQFAPYVDRIFAGAAAGVVPTTLDSWIAALGFSFQIYFDFSAYSDMALGLALLFGFRLSLNFNSPYKAASIIEFWRRWHITLSSFLRDYVYIPLGGNRKGTRRRFTNLMATMLIGGLWHGAAWNFVIWGGLHGTMLGVNHGWRRFLTDRGWQPAIGNPGYRVASVLLTLLLVVVTWVFFRAPDFATAMTMLSSMFAAPGPAASTEALSRLSDGELTRILPLIVAATGLVLFAPNAAQIARTVCHDVIADDPRHPLESPKKPIQNWPDRLKISASMAVGSAVASLCFFVLWHRIVIDAKDIPFIYFQF